MLIDSLATFLITNQSSVTNIMEFSFSLENVTGVKTVFLVDKALRPRCSTGSDSTHRHLVEVIDSAGAASARAQKLPAAITTSSKLSYTDQRVYMYSDYCSERQKDILVGFIKVGTKKLFLYDHNGNQREVSPLCILDFYVHESKQRKGYGKLLYEHMIQLEKVSPAHLAVDRPSDKFLGFLAKHYSLRATLPQVNNYVIFEGFFNNRPDKPGKRSKKASRPTINQDDSFGEVSSDFRKQNNLTNYSRATTNTHQANQSQGCSYTKSNQSQDVHSISSQSQKPLPNSLRDSHKSVPLTSQSSSTEQLAALSDVPLNRPSSNEVLVTQLRDSTPPVSAVNQTRSQPNPDMNHPQVLQNGERNQSAQRRAYSRHASSALPHQYSTSNQSDYKEPLRTRYGSADRPPLNSHHQILNNQGHLKVTPSSHSHSRVNHPKQEAEEWAQNFHQSGKAAHQNSSWNIFGVPPGYSHSAAGRSAL